MNVPAIEVRGARKTFRVRGGLWQADRHVVAVDDVSFAVPAGGVLGVVGESGCGKSTLARLILGLLPPDSGDIAVEGQRVLDMDRVSRPLIQPVFQDPSPAQPAGAWRHRRHAAGAQAPST
jgi:peptide/nickel transport system ATP-binding protein